MSQADIFLKLDTVEGESQDDKHSKELEILSYSWGATNAGSGSVGGGLGAGKVQFQDFHFTLPVNKAVDVLFLRCAEGKHLPKAVLTQRVAGGTQQDALIIEFKDLLVSSVQLGNSSGAGVGTVQVSLNFSEYKIQSFEQGKDGATKKAGNTGWDQKKNVKV